MKHYKCPYCGLIFDNKNSYAVHIGICLKNPNFKPRNHFIKYNKDFFISEAIKKFGNKFDYSLVYDFKNYKKDKVKIKCNDCGNIFETTPKMHLISGMGGCKVCSKKEKYTTKRFIEEANKIHNNKYDYSLVNIEECFKNKSPYITIICPIHGKFQQKWKLHLSGCGCKKCFLESQHATTEKFIKKAKEVHGNKYDYSKTNYIGRHYDVSIICPKHGEFTINAANHLLGHGCTKCSHNFNWYKSEKIALLTKYDIENLSSEDLMLYILSGELPEEFMKFTYSLPGSMTRKEAISGYIKKINIIENEEDENNDINEEKLKHIDNHKPDNYEDNNDTAKEIGANKTLKTFEEIQKLFNENKVYRSIIISKINKLFYPICRYEESNDLNKMNIKLKEYKNILNNPHSDFERFIYTYFFNEYNMLIELRNKIINNKY